MPTWLRRDDGSPTGGLHAAAWRQFLICCFLAIFGVRAFFVERFGASVAQVDEWEATGKEVLSAWDHGTFSTAALFQAHNGDHRIVATRLWEIFWYRVNGAWDPKLVMVANALVYALAATMLTHLLVHGLPRRRFPAGAAFAALFAFPFGYQNLLWGFQSQFDFFLLAVAGGWLALGCGRPVLALVVAAFAPFTLGAGPVLAASYLAHAAAARLNRAWSTAQTIGFSVCAVAIAAAGASLRGSLAAPLGTLHDQAYTLLKLLAWPYSNLVLLVSELPASLRLIPAKLVNFPSAEHSALNGMAEIFREHPPVLVAVLAALAVVMVLPLGILLWRVLRERRMPECAWGPVCLGLFAALMQVASAIARSNELLVQTRYIDLVLLTGFASGAALVVIALRSKTHRRLAFVWGILVAPGYLATMGATLIQLRNSHLEQWVPAVRAYFPSHDRALLPQNTNRQLPILEQDPSAFAALLDDPAMVLPLSIVDPARDPRPVARFAFAIGRWGLAIAVAALLAGVAIVRRSRRPRNVPSASAGGSGDPALRQSAPL